MDSHKEGKINRLFDRFLVYGGFPELFDAGELECKEVIQEYFRTLVQRDLVERFNCSKNTISNYISYMEKSFFLYQALFYSNNVKDQLQYPRKVYFIDMGFLKYLSLNYDKSKSLENLVAVELKRRGYELYYWQNPKGEEVDFLLMENGRVCQLIQVSYDISLPHTRERELRALEKGMKHFQLNKGIILTVSHEESIKKKGFRDRSYPCHPLVNTIIKKYHPLIFFLICSRLLFSE